MNSLKSIELPGLNCGVCGYRTCDELSARLEKEPGMIKRCIPLSDRTLAASLCPSPCPQVAISNCPASSPSSVNLAPPQDAWIDSLGREFDFILEHFPEDPGPREIILPHNPMLTREMEIKPGEIMIGRPLGMSCGCPVTHCGIVKDVDKRTGVMTWCVTGPLDPRLKGFKDIGYYIAEAYEGLITKARSDIKIGMRYFFQPRMCMLQWRHSGIVNYLNRTAQGLQVRIEGLMIG